ncbi:MAG: hydrogenase maturation protease [Chitinispirillaceae bacterium]|nr:hydrogenase maturation protease [Chitinispirillaceae bacterium]
MMKNINKRSSILIFGFGNPGRQDDGLGIALVDRLEPLDLPSCTFEQNYQLNAEDALLIADYDIVIFADASVAVASVALTEIEPSHEIGFTTHAMHPSSVVGLCNELYSKFPKCYLLEMRGFEWEMKEGLSEEAEVVLREATEMILSKLEKGIFTPSV